MNFGCITKATANNELRLWIGCHEVGWDREAQDTAAGVCACVTLRSPARSGTSFHRFVLSNRVFVPSRTLTLTFHMLAVGSEASDSECIHFTDIVIAEVTAVIRCSHASVEH